MPQNKIHILSTRPLEQGLIDQAAGKGIIIDTVSFIHTEPVDNKDLRDQIRELGLQPLTIVFTSANAVEAVVQHLQGRQPAWRIFCIGQATRQLIARNFAAAMIAGTANSAGELADVIINKTAIEEVIFFCGDQRRQELLQQLAQQHIAVKEIVVYRTFADKYSLQKQYDGVLFFSPSAVNSFFSNNTVTEKTVLFAIGNTTADTIKNFTNNIIIISDTPGKKHLVNSMMNYFFTGSGLPVS